MRIVRIGQPVRGPQPAPPELEPLGPQLTSARAAANQARIYRRVASALYRRRIDLAKRTGRIELLRVEEVRERRRLQSIAALGLAAPSPADGQAEYSDDDDAA